MQIIQSSGLQFTVGNNAADELRTVIPNSAVVQDLGTRKALLVRWEQDETERLAQYFDTLRPNLTTDEVPSPLLRDYKWPGIYTPFDHQKDTASFLSLRRRAFCFSEMGTGKTSASIWAADYLMNLGLVNRVLVICPLSIMYSAWQADIFKTAMHRSCVVAYSKDPDKRRKLVNGIYDFTIVNYDGMSVCFDAINAKAYDLIIVDEANHYKQVTTKRWRTLAKIMRPSTRMWLMTGTPAAQSPEDAFGLARLVSPGRVPKFKTAWRDQVMTQVTKFKWVPKSDSKNKVFRALQPAIRYTKKECLDLPPVTYQTREIVLSVQVARYYTELRKQFMIQAAGEEISAVNAASVLSKLLQISGGAVYTNDHNILEFDVSPRLNELREILDETEHKVLVYVPYLHTIQVVFDFLTTQGVTCEIIQGSVSPTARRDIVTRFQTQTSPRVLIIQPQAGKEGLTLTAADTLVFWSPVMSVDTYLQVVGRVDRVGQVNNVTVIHLQGSEVERKMYSMLQGKIDAHTSLTQLYKSEMELT